MSIVYGALLFIAPALLWLAPSNGLWRVQPWEQGRALYVWWYAVFFGGLLLSTFLRGELLAP